MSYNLDCINWGVYCDSSSVETCEECSTFTHYESTNEDEA